MSKSTKAKPPRKKNISKKKSSIDPILDNPTSLVKAPPSGLKLEQEDHLILRLAYAELQNKQYQLRDAQREMEETTSNWGKQLSIVNKKYDLDSTKDKIDLGTGEIKKG